MATITLPAFDMSTRRKDVRSDAFTDNWDQLLPLSVLLQSLPPLRTDAIILLPSADTA